MSEVIKVNVPKIWFKYCEEPISMIEGFDSYYLSVKDNDGVKWHCHHRKETE